MSIALDILTVATSWAYVYLAPYTKVEESFNLHATHDVLFYGVRPDALPQYDHFVFPGAVPRSFIGSVLLGYLSQPAIQLACSLELLRDKFDLQIIVRLVLATINAIGLCLIRRGVARRFGRLTGLLFSLLTCTQFHLPFWIGRTLPNMVALFPVNVAIFLLVNLSPNTTRPSQRATHWAIVLLTFTTVAFRSEVVLLLGPLVLQALLSGWTSLRNILRVGIVAGVSSAALTVAVDSYFWQQWPLWPELYGIYFNVLQGKSSEWGVSPWHTYVTSFLPKLLLSSLPLSFIGITSEARVRTLLVPAIAYVLLISNLGHKEWRFIIYVVPLFNVAAARGAAWLVSRRKGTLFGRLCFLAVLGLLACNCLATYIFASASIPNYPGGEALAQFNAQYVNQKNVHVHISNFAAQTGASLFLQAHAPPHLDRLCASAAGTDFSWTYDKTEHLTLDALTSMPGVTHAIAEVDPTTQAPVASALHRWRTVDSIESFYRWSINPALRQAMKVLDFRALLEPLKMVKSVKLVILERNMRR